jgi:Protein of unknown function (DUF1492).
MRATEYLEQIRRLDRQIDSKLAILSSLEASATKTTSTMEGEVVSHTRNVHALQDTIAKIMDLRNEIDADTDALVDLRDEAQRIIRSIDDASCQTALALHYIWLKPWDDVAAALSYNLRSIYKVRDRAIARLDELIDNGQIVIGQSRALEGNAHI